jgi:Ca2+-binding RTX toxin-like protein
MADLYITTFGSAWTGGYSISSITQGDNGWTYLAGAKGYSAANGNTVDQNLVILGYQNGILKWEKEFGGPKSEEGFTTVYARDGFVYAVGGIKSGFDTPTGRDAPSLADQAFPDLKDTNTSAPVLIKLKSETGDLEFGRVISTNKNGNDIASGLFVDTYGNIYLNVGTNSQGFGGLKKFNASGIEVWAMPENDHLYSDSGQIGGTGGKIQGDDLGNIYTFSGYQLAKLNFSNSNPERATLLGTYTPILPSNPFYGNNTEDGTYYKDFIVDDRGDAYFVAVETSSLTTGSTIVTKVEHLHNFYTHGLPNFIWTTRFEGNGWNSPGSINFDTEGNLLIAGQMGAWNQKSAQSLNSVVGKGKFDGYLVTLDPETGAGAQTGTTIIGTPENEWLNQAIVNANGDILIAGDFSSKYYSLIGTAYQNIYLITKDGFTLMGNELDNAMQTGDGKDIVDGGKGDDTIGTGAGNDTVYGGEGNDLIIGGDGKGNDRYFGGKDIDTLKYTSAAWGITVNLGSGTATSNTKTVNKKKVADAAKIGSDKFSEIENLIAGDWNDNLSGSKLSNKIEGGNGDDRIDGKEGNDTLIGGVGADMLIGGVGDDDLQGDDGNDSLIGGNGADTLSGSIGNDRLQGDAGNDNLYGGTGSDTLIGGLGNDSLQADDGDDILQGGIGNDTMTGGTGADRFVFDSKLGNTNVDTIADFGYEAGIGSDKIVLSKSIFKFAKGMVNRDGSFAQSDGGYLESISQYLKFSPNADQSISVQFDADGSGKKATFVEFAKVTLVGVTELTLADFIVS